MAIIALEDMQRGWKVFGGFQEVGEVADVEPAQLGVKHGRLTKHVTRVPTAKIVEAADGVVDLRPDQQVRDQFGLD